MDSRPSPYHRPDYLFERKTDALIELRAEEYLNRKIATSYVQDHIPEYRDPDDHATFESYLEWLLEEVECGRERRPGSLTAMH